MLLIMLQSQTGGAKETVSLKMISLIWGYKMQSRPKVKKPGSERRWKCNLKIPNWIFFLREKILLFYVYYKHFPIFISYLFILTIFFLKIRFIHQNLYRPSLHYHLVGLAHPGQC